MAAPPPRPGHRTSSTPEAGTAGHFYQYFADVEAAILVLARRWPSTASAWSGSWPRAPGRAGRLPHGARATDAFFDFWDQHRPVLRVVDLATEEGDNRFRNIRAAAQRGDDRACGVVSRFQADGRNLGVDPMAQGGTLVTTLANTAAHHHGFEFWGISTTDVRVVPPCTGARPASALRREPARRSRRRRHRRQPRDRARAGRGPGGGGAAGGRVGPGHRPQRRGPAITSTPWPGRRGRAGAYGCDVSDEDQVEAAMAATLADHGKVDSLFANAGVGGVVPFVDMTLDEWRRVMAVNLDGAFLTRRRPPPGRAGRGRLPVGVSSVSAIHGAPRMEHYAASKTAAGARPGPGRRARPAPGCATPCCPAGPTPT